MIISCSVDELSIRLRGMLKCGEDECVPLHVPRLDGKVREYVLECLDTNWVSTAGGFVTRFEREVAGYTGARHAIAVNSGTSALHAGLHLLGVGPGDVVVMPALSFVATANAVRYTGAEPVFLDIERSNLGLAPEVLAGYLARARRDENGACLCPLTGRPMRAVIAVHVFGLPPRVEEIAGICRSHGMPLVEDAAEAMGSRIGAIHAGRFGDVATLSFNGNKILTTGGGGAILTDNDALAERARHLTSTAKVDHQWEYWHDEVGFNYRMPNINAAVGCGQIPQLEHHVNRKRRLARAYEEFFADYDWIDFIVEPEGTRSNYWLNAIVVPSASHREELLAALNDRRLMSRPVWTPLHRLPMYSRCAREQLRATEDLASRLINLPSSPYLDR
jgi:perosamine synthetase